LGYAKMMTRIRPFAMLCRLGEKRWKIPLSLEIRRGLSFCHRIHNKNNGLSALHSGRDEMTRTTDTSQGVFGFRQKYCWNEDVNILRET
jgi:hypothetical protein